MDCIVKIKPATDQEQPRVRLVRARTKAAAIAHVAKDLITADEASTEEILKLGSDVKLEISGQEAASS